MGWDWQLLVRGWGGCLCLPVWKLRSHEAWIQHSFNGHVRLTSQRCPTQPLSILREATYTRILKLEPAIPAHLSNEAKAFIRAALKKEPAQRPSVHQLLRHPWLRAYQVGRDALGSPERKPA